MKLLDRLEAGLMDPDVLTAELLRLCVLLGGQTGSTSLRDWARQELDGYGDTDVELPEYRRVHGVLKLAGTTSNAHVSGQSVDPIELGLPETMEEVLRGPVLFAQPLAELEQMSRGSSVLIAPPNMTALVTLANAQSRNPDHRINSLYWELSPASVGGIVDRVRTQLAGLVAELRAATPAGQALPSQSSADQAVQVIIHGHQRAPISIQTGYQHSLVGTDAAPRPWQRVLSFVRGSWGWLVGMATILGLIVAIATWQGWTWPGP